MTAPHDEQTETELEQIMADFEVPVMNRTPMLHTLEAWSRKQTEGVLDDLQKKKVFYGKYSSGNEILAVPVAAIEAAQARVREGQ